MTEPNRRESTPPLELWGGVECTRNRVGDRYFDQIARSGHDRRIEDLDRFAGLGLHAIRYPALWEWAASRADEPYDWSWPERRLARLRELGLRPIVGFVHHGSGPPYTNLLDPDFADGLARYARAFAERFPWVADYTPVNEPLTTARFSALYGAWYPHARDDLSFATALLNQCRAVAHAMAAVREVRPDARLVQTEDLGQVFGTPALAYQVDFENERRWLTFDLLCGRVDRRHPLGRFFLDIGVPERSLAWFLDHPCPPDIVGINHYLTSDRFLDDRIDRYPAHTVGGNGRHAYADVEAVRVLPEGGPGIAGLLRQVHDRYRLPTAVTEAHLGCDREHQVRWLRDAWRGAEAARGAGVEVRAVTVWSLLGTYDWDSLVTRDAGHYEPGAFDVRGPEPRPTALAHLVRDLADGNAPVTPVLEQPGWWHRPDRLIYAEPRTCSEPTEAESRPLLIVGSRGRIARAFARLCEARGLPYRLIGRPDVDIADPDSAAAALRRINPWAVVNAAGFSRLDEAERHPRVCRRANTLGAAISAAVCAELEIPLLIFSSHYVFDGSSGNPYDELSDVNPVNALGRSHAEAERLVVERHPHSIVVRAGALFGAWDSHDDPIASALGALAEGTPVVAADDILVSPTFLPDLASTCLDLILDEAWGLWHVAGASSGAWYPILREAARRADLDPVLVVGRPARSLNAPARRPPNGTLSSRRLHALPAFDDSLDRFLAARPRALDEARPSVVA